MTRILVTGASGLLGANLAIALAGDHEVYGLFYTHPLPLPGVIPAACDLRDRSGLMALVAGIAPEVVFHAAAMTNVDACENNPSTAWAINVEGTESLVQACRSSVRYFCHISTDYVYSGLRGMYTEADPPSPINVYGRTKLAAEQAVARSGLDFALVRTSFFGWSPPPAKCFMEEALRNLLAGREVRAWTNRYSTPLFVNDLATVLIALMESGHTGLWHAGSAVRASNWQLCRCICDVFGCDPGLVMGAVSGPDAGRAARPLDTSLNSRRLEACLHRPSGSYVEAVRSWKQVRDVDGPFAVREG